MTYNPNRNFGVTHNLSEPQNGPDIGGSVEGTEYWLKDVQTAMVYQKGSLSRYMEAWA